MAAAALIERYDDCLLIVTTDSADAVSRTWRFPRGSVKPDEFAEAALRRSLLEDLGVGIEIVVGAPPIVCPIDGMETEVRYFYCGLATGVPTPGRYVAIKWVIPGALADYRFDAASQPVADWLEEQAGASAQPGSTASPSKPVAERPPELE